MIKVLEDLQTYARQNGLPKLADHLDQARLLALTEIASAAVVPNGFLSDEPDDPEPR